MCVSVKVSPKPNGGDRQTDIQTSEHEAQT